MFTNLFGLRKNAGALSPERDFERTGLSQFGSSSSSSSSSSAPSSSPGTAPDAAAAVHTESLDFDEMEGIMWRKHHFRRFFQDRGVWFTAERRTITWRWALVIVTGILVAVMGACVQQLTMTMMSFKFATAKYFMTGGARTQAYFAFLAISLLYSTLAGLLCWFEPAAAGSGIPEIKAYLNGVNLNNVVRLRVLFSKVRARTPVWTDIDIGTISHTQALQLPPQVLEPPVWKRRNRPFLSIPIAQRSWGCVCQCRAGCPWARRAQ